MDNKLPLFNYMIKAAERLIPQIAYTSFTEHVFKFNYFKIIKEKP